MFIVKDSCSFLFIFYSMNNLISGNMQLNSSGDIDALIQV